MRVDNAVLSVLTLTIALVGTAGCARDTVSGSAVPNSAAAPNPVTSSTTLAPPPPDFGPLGYGKVRLGMSMTEAQATGEIAKIEDMGGDPPGCGRYTAGAGWSGFYNQGEIVAITHNKLPAHTPEGIAVGSTLEQVRAAYPTLKLGHNWSSADIPGHPAAHYGFLGIRTESPPEAKVSQMLLYNDKDTCHN